MTLLRFLDEQGKTYPVWKEVTLKEIASIVGGGTPDTKNVSFWNGDLNWFTPTEIGKSKYVSKSLRKITHEGLKNSSARELPPGTILLTSRASLGRMAILTEPAATNQGFQSLIAKDEVLYNIYLYYCQPIIEKFMLKHASGSTFLEISGRQISSLSLSLPSLPEQEKIAGFLSALDSRIELQEKKISLLREQKKGYVQRIFNRELRFQDDNGNPYPEWKEAVLGDVVTSITTGKLDANAAKPNGKFRFYTCAAHYSYIDTAAFDDEVLLVSGNGANVGYIHYYKGKFNAYQRTYVLSGFLCDVHYLKYYLELNLPIRISLEKNTGSMPYIVMGTLTDMKVVLPSLAEQGKIAKFLSTLDDKISLEEQKLMIYKLEKKGYMQRIFK